MRGGGTCDQDRIGSVYFLVGMVRHIESPLWDRPPICGTADAHERG